MQSKPWMRNMFHMSICIMYGRFVVLRLCTSGTAERGGGSGGTLPRGNLVMSPPNGRKSFRNFSMSFFCECFVVWNAYVQKEVLWQPRSQGLFGFGGGDKASAQTRKGPVNEVGPLGKKHLIQPQPLPLCGPCTFDEPHFSLPTPCVPDSLFDCGDVRSVLFGHVSREDPSLEQQMAQSVRANLLAMGQRCVQELERFARMETSKDSRASSEWSSEHDASTD